ncbi:MAG: hypothetical protein V7K64_19395 [Nostoc sp.]
MVNFVAGIWSLSHIIWMMFSFLGGDDIAFIGDRESVRMAIALIIHF